MYYTISTLLKLNPVNLLFFIIFLNLSDVNACTSYSFNLKISKSLIASSFKTKETKEYLSGAN